MKIIAQFVIQVWASKVNLTNSSSHSKTQSVATWICPSLCLSSFLSSERAFCTVFDCSLIPTTCCIIFNSPLTFIFYSPRSRVSFFSSFFTAGKHGNIEILCREKRWVEKQRQSVEGGWDGRVEKRDKGRRIWESAEGEGRGRKRVWRAVEWVEKWGL